MRNFISIGLVAAGLLVAAYAPAQTQSEMNLSADEEYKKADAELNALYKQLTNSLNDAQKEALKHAQVAWIKYRDACVKSEGAMFEGGSIQPIVMLGASTELTTEKVARLRKMLRDAVAKQKTALPALDIQQAALQKADAELNKVYKEFMATGPNPAVKDAQVAWLTYRDLCAKAESALYDKDAAEVAAAKCLTELTQARTARLKGLFLEGYPGNKGSAVPAKP